MIKIEKCFISTFLIYKKHQCPVLSCTYEQITEKKEVYLQESSACVLNKVQANHVQEESVGPKQSPEKNLSSEYM